MAKDFSVGGRQARRQVFSNEQGENYKGHPNGKKPDATVPHAPGHSDESWRRCHEVVCRPVKKDETTEWIAAANGDPELSMALRVCKQINPLKNIGVES